MKKFTAILAALMIATTIFTVTAIPASAATSGVVGAFESSYCTVTLQNTGKPAYVTFKCKTWGMIKTGGQATIVLRDKNNRWLREWVAKDGDRLYLGNNHSVYRIYVKAYKASVYDWTIEKPQNATIK